MCNPGFFEILIFRFIDGGGWAMLNVWLAEAKKAQNNVLLVELLQVIMWLYVLIPALWCVQLPISLVVG